MNRSAFKLHIAIDNSFSNHERILRNHPGYKVDNVIQLKLDRDSFIDLFKDSELGVGNSERYSSIRLLQRLQIFFSIHYNNYNSLASDITTLILNENNDIDVNPVLLEAACRSNTGEIFQYFFLSNVSFDSQAQVTDNTHDASLYDDGVDADGTGDPLKVYQYIAREIDNMISRHIVDSSSDESYYSSLDELYRIESDAFFDNIVVGDSIFIEGAFSLPNSKIIPVILQFVHSHIDVYGSSPQSIQTIQNFLTIDSGYDISTYFM